MSIPPEVMSSGQTDPTLAKLRADVEALGWYEGVLISRSYVLALIDAAIEGAQAKPAEAAAWRYRYHPKGEWHLASSPCQGPFPWPDYPQFEQEPLYVSPQPAEVPALTDALTNAAVFVLLGAMPAERPGYSVVPDDRLKNLGDELKAWRLALKEGGEE